MRICDSKERNLLLNVFDINGFDDLYNIESLPGYEKMLFSVFDHWLDEKESKASIIIYDKKIFQSDSQKLQIYLDYEKAFLKFYTKLYSKYEIYSGFIDANNRTIFFRFENLEDLIHHIKAIIKEELYSALIIPNLHSVIFNLFDYTHCIYIREIEDSGLHINTLNKLVKDSGLNILP